MQSDFGNLSQNMKSYNNSTASAGLTQTFVRSGVPPGGASADLSFVSGVGNKQNYLSQQ